MRSRVMPGSLVTMERRVPVKRLKSVDLRTLGRPTMTSDGSFCDMSFIGVETLSRDGIVCRFEGFPIWNAEAGGPSPRGFLRKNVILRELECEDVQECDSKGFILDWGDFAADREDSRGLVGAIPTHDSTKC